MRRAERRAVVEAVGGGGGGVGMSSGIMRSLDHFPARDDGELSHGDGGGRSLAGCARSSLNRSVDETAGSFDKLRTGSSTAVGANNAPNPLRMTDLLCCELSRQDTSGGGEAGRWRIGGEKSGSRDAMDAAMLVSESYKDCIRLKCVCRSALCRAISAGCGQE